MTGLLDEKTSSLTYRQLNQMMRSTERTQEERPHQGEGIENELLIRVKQPGRPKTKQVPIENQIVSFAEVRCRQRLGGLLKSYSRRAA